MCIAFFFNEPHIFEDDVKEKFTKAKVEEMAVIIKNNTSKIYDIPDNKDSPKSKMVGKILNHNDDTKIPKKARNPYH